MKSHQHSFNEAEWPFDEPVNTMASLTRPVLRGDLPILLVSHDEDGDWQFLCGTTTDPKDAAIVCLGCAYQKDRSIGLLADLPLGWQAWGDTINDSWKREPSEYDTESA